HQGDQLHTLLVVRDLRYRLLHFKLGTHFLDLRGLLFYCCRETRNGVFQFRDSHLLFLEFTEHGLRVRALGTACPHLFSRSIHRVSAQVTIAVDVYWEGPSTNHAPVNAADKGRREIGAAGGNPADGNHIFIAGETRIAEIEIVAHDIRVGTGVSA